jgi:predicted enzyme related to lactoylglutathione lyase
VAVEDIDATAARATRLGGTLRLPPTEIPEVGIFAVIADGLQAVIGLFEWP